MVYNKIEHYLSIKENEDEYKFLNKLRKLVGHLEFIMFSKPTWLSGTYKVLTLHYKAKIKNVIKVEGPEFIIDKIYNKFKIKI
jgi:hypothetical protein